MNQRGQFTLPLMGWVAVAVGVAFVGLSIALKVQSSRLESCKKEAAAFVAQVEANGKIAEAAAKLKEAQDAKQIKDALTQRDVALAKLRGHNSSGYRLPTAAIAAGSGSQVCFGADAYHAAMGAFGKSLERFVDDAHGFAEQGDAAQIDAVTLIQAWPLKMAQEIAK